MQLHVMKHPLVEHKLTVLRDENTPSNNFRQLVSELVTLEAGHTLTKNPRPMVIPILRAGLGMLDGMMRLMPTAEVGFLGMKRDERTLDVITYAQRLPEDLTGRQCFILDPMLATGGTLVTAIHYLAERGARNITAIDIIAAPEGLERLKKEVDPSINFDVVVAGVDDRLNENGYIVPGLGDAGDRLYGVVD